MRMQKIRLLLSLGNSKMQDIRLSLEESQKPWVFGHVNPDADCIGSLLVIAGALRAMGKQPHLVLPTETVSQKYKFMLDLAPEFLSQPPRHPRDADLIIVLDTALLKRINKPTDLDMPAAPICNIDHHLGNDRFGTFNWIDVSAASTSQMVCLLLKAMNVNFTPNQATLLYAGLHSDTCGFSLAGTDPIALAVGSELARANAKIGWVCQKLHRSLKLSEFKLMKVVYANTQLSPCSRVAWSTVTQAEMNAIGAKPIDIDEQVSVPRSIDGVKIAVLFSETRPGLVRINLRAEDDINILPLAKFLGGGGHAQAAGATQHGNFDDVVRLVTQTTVEYLDNPDGLPQKENEKIKTA